jgi:hypothetical protein
MANPQELVPRTGIGMLKARHAPANLSFVGLATGNGNTSLHARPLQQGQKTHPDWCDDFVTNRRAEGQCVKLVRHVGEGRHPVCSFPIRVVDFARARALVSGLRRNDGALFLRVSQGLGKPQ